MLSSVVPDKKAAAVLVAEEDAKVQAELPVAEASGKVIAFLIYFRFPVAPNFGTFTLSVSTAGRSSDSKKGGRSVSQ